MSIKIIKTGLQTSIQDLGRHGHRHLGVAQSGAIDSYSLQLANWLVAKPLNSACIEVYLVGPHIEIQKDMSIAITGAFFELFLNDTLIKANTSHRVKAGDILKFGKLQFGARAYIAFSANLTASPVMDSFSSDTTSGISISKAPVLAEGEIIALTTPQTDTPFRVAPKELLAPPTKRIVVRVTRGLEFSLMDKQSKESFFNSEYTVDANSNRMGLRLKGNKLVQASPHELFSSPIVNGTVQLPNSGQPIITLNEGQTIGGYPRIAQVISNDLPLLGQVAPNTHLRFYPVTLDKAHQAFNEKQKLLNKLGYKLY